MIYIFSEILLEPMQGKDRGKTAAEDKKINADRVYHIVSRINGKAVSREAMEYLQTQEEGIIMLLAEKLNPQTGKVAQIEDAKRAVREVKAEKQRRSTQKIEINTPNLQLGTMLRAGKIKEMLPLCKSIISLNEGDECMIFGVIYAGETEMGIENEEGSIIIKRIETECLLAPGICAAFNGVVENGEFIIRKVFLPKQKNITKSISINSTNSTIPNMLFFSSKCTLKEIEKIKDAIKGYNEAEMPIAVVVLMVEVTQVDSLAARVYGAVGSAHPEIEFIIVPNNKEKLYPLPGQGKKGNVVVAGNPISIHIDGNTLLVGRFNITDGLRGRYIVNGDVRKELARAMLGQMSYNPFISYADLSYLDNYDGIIIGDRYDTYAYKEEGKVFGLCGSFEKEGGQFLFYSADSQELEVSALLS